MDAYANLFAHLEYKKTRKYIYRNTRLKTVYYNKMIIVSSKQDYKMTDVKIF